MTVPKRGARALVERVETVLTDHLQARVDELITEGGYSWSLTIGTIEGRASVEAVTLAQSVEVSVLRRRDVRDQLQNWGAGKLQDVTLRIKVHVGRVDLTDIDEARDIVEEAVADTLEGYLRRDGNPAGVWGLAHTDAEHARSSDRQRVGARGLRGAPPEGFTDAIETELTIRQRVARTMPH